MAPMPNSTIDDGSGMVAIKPWSWPELSKYDPTSVVPDIADIRVPFVPKGWSIVVKDDPS